MTSAASDVFISYKAEERKRLIPLVEAFEAEGFSVWWDQHIGGGTNWREEIETHLDAAKVVIVVWSKRSIGPEGRFVRDEAAQAQEAGQYLPITIDNVRPPLGSAKSRPSTFRVGGASATIPGSRFFARPSGTGWKARTSRAISLSQGGRASTGAQPLWEARALRPWQRPAAGSC
jgi:hypothetical protein